MVHCVNVQYADWGYTLVIPCADSSEAEARAAAIAAAEADCKDRINVRTDILS